MISPNIQHPIRIGIQSFQRGVAEEDAGYREPVQGGTFGDTVYCQGQVLWGAEKGLDITRLGTQDDSDGHVVFRTVDLRFLGITLHIGDRFVTFGDVPNLVEREVYISRLAPMAHYPGANGNAMIKAYFKDRQPVRGT